MQLMKIMSMTEKTLKFLNLRDRIKIKKGKRKQIYKIKKNFMRIISNNE